MSKRATMQKPYILPDGRRRPTCRPPKGPVWNPGSLPPFRHAQPPRGNSAYAFGSRMQSCWPSRSRSRAGAVEEPGSWPSSLLARKGFVVSRGHYDALKLTGLIEKTRPAIRFIDEKLIHRSIQKFTTARCMVAPGLFEATCGSRLHSAPLELDRLLGRGCYRHGAPLELESRRWKTRVIIAAFFLPTVSPSRDRKRNNIRTLLLPTVSP